MSENQHGFRRGKSYLSQLMEHYQALLNIMENGHTADVIYLDFAMAFDKVDHGLLIKKLKLVGVGGSVLKWIYDFLSDRKQVVTVEGELSEKKEVVSGVPQGSVLGSLLFIIYRNDLANSY